jgi:osmotically-inducible protein OsmY
LAAEQTAGHTLGVIQVRNELKVRPAQARPDAAIRGDVQRELAADPIVDRETIKVAVIDGEVFLSGTAGSHYERSRAEELALRVAGVKQLRNRIEVAKNAPEFDSALGVYGSESQGERPADATAKIHVKSDRVIQRDIESELWWSPWVEANEIDVSVKGGVATLEGTIDSEHERTAAIENAFEGGAVVVRDELKVRK